MITSKQWSRVVNPADTIPRLLHFLDQLLWFPKEVLPVPPAVPRQLD